VNPDERIRVDCPPVDLRRTLGPVRRGSTDPTTAAKEGEWWWATHTIDGPATLRIAAADRTGDPVDAVEASSWGPGAVSVLDRVPGLIGAHDPLESFQPDDLGVARLVRDHPGTRMGRTDSVFEALLPTILGQKVIGKEAKRSFARLVRAHGDEGPGPPGLRVAPRADLIASLPYHRWHPLGVERRRAEIVQRAAREAGRLEATVDRPEALRLRLESLPGIGPWTTANVLITAVGDPDAVVVGDYNLPAIVAWLLAGEARAGDERMLELLEPFRGDRARVQRLAKFSGTRPPRRGPKLGFREIEHS
jgi:3-methyladenine DNA glycosylase/8-oxoguanine DNA glycosylase